MQFSLDICGQIMWLNAMTNRLAIYLALAITAFFMLDHFVFGLDAGQFLIRKGIDLITWMKFWR